MRDRLRVSLRYAWLWLFVVVLLVPSPLRELRFLGRATLHAQAGAPNGRQLNVTVTNAAVVQLTVPAGTTFCTIAISTNPVNYDIGSAATSAAPTTTTGIPINAGGIVQFGSFLLCRNFGVIAQAANATMNAIFLR